MVGPTEDFEEWYRAVHPRLGTALAYAFGDVEVAQDAADEAVARAFERWDQVSAMASPAGWTYRVAFNVARRRLRRRSIEARLLGSTVPGTVGPPAGELWDIVAALPPRQRRAVLLRHVGQLEEHEIGRVMGITRGTVSSTLRAAYRSLRMELEEVPAVPAITRTREIR
ncbi:MAG: RNA polymerase sigma factor [Acidimicrobiales bacterium]